MYYVKDIESFGTGLKRIANVCDTAGVKVEFQMLKKGFAVIFYRPDASVFNDVNIVDNIVDSIVDSDQINVSQARIVALMCENPRVSAKQLAQIIGIAQRNVQVYIRELKERGIIERSGAAFGGCWVVKKPECIERAH